MPSVARMWRYASTVQESGIRCAGWRTAPEARVTWCAMAGWCGPEYRKTVLSVQNRPNTVMSCDVASYLAERPHCFTFPPNKRLVGVSPNPTLTLHVEFMVRP